MGFMIVCVPYFGALEGGSVGSRGVEGEVGVGGRGIEGLSWGVGVGDSGGDDRGRKGYGLSGVLS